VTKLWQNELLHCQAHGAFRTGRGSPSRHVLLDPFLDFRPDRALGNPQIKLGLKPEPQFRAGPEILGQAKRGIGRDGALPVDDRANPARWDREVAGETVDAVA
jgi:hypothetical protein